ncbi:hypothetical protein V1Y59_04975 [Gordonia sp. PKS22-38]|uniref:Uncharacterized protein n=1 Tax=Gordonia prachuapensis TaxID=3115651 RepID=A0ABU7MQ14_9ACTN|nr:hypothetical protein [Gordonia sp. PKS22-38]
MTRIRLVIVGLILTLAIAAPGADASPRHPGTGDRITLVLTSDTKVNRAVSWYDSHNRLRNQTAVPLTHFDRKTEQWSGSLTFTSRVRHQRIDAVFRSSGRFAACAVWVNEVRIREIRARSTDLAVARCSWDDDARWRAIA